MNRQFDIYDQIGRIFGYISQNLQTSNPHYVECHYLLKYSQHQAALKSVSWKSNFFFTLLLERHASIQVLNSRNY